MNKCQSQVLGVIACLWAQEIEEIFQSLLMLLEMIISENLN